MRGIKTALAVSVLVTMVGCQSTSDVPKEVSTNKQAEQQVTAFSQYESAKEKYQLWLEKLKQNADLKIYSKDTYADMLESWGEAVEVYQEIALDPAKATKSYSVFSSATYFETFEKELTLVEDNFSKLLELKKVADEALSDSQAQMAYLDQIETSTVYPSDYNRVKNAYLKLYKSIEEGDLDDAQSRQVVFLNKAKELEVKVVIKKYVSPLKSDLAKLKREDFDEIAAISFAKAAAEISATEQVIKANSRQLKSINEAVEDAQFELDHVWNIASEVKLLSSVKSDKFEPSVLAFENKLLQVSKAINGADYRDRSLREQTEQIVNSIEERNSDSQTALSDSEGRYQKLKNENSDLLKQLTGHLNMISQIQNEKANLEQQILLSKAKIASLEALVETFKQQAEKKATLADDKPAETASTEAEISDNKGGEAVTEKTAAAKTEAAEE